MATLTCPKCGSAWQSFERSGITIDSCTGCRGVFLDRGELERLVQAESEFGEGRSFARAEELGYADRYRERYPVAHHRERDDDDRHHGHYGHGRKRHRERGGFLEDFFGGDD